MTEAGTIKSMLEALAKQLNGGDAINYTASFGVWRSGFLGSRGVDAIVRGTVSPSAILSGVRSAGADDVAMALTDALGFHGDPGSHPCRDARQRIWRSGDAPQLVDHVAELVSGADLVHRFYFVEGHPFYPVFWDFAFVATAGATATVLVGSASD